MFTLADAIAAGARIDALYMIRDLAAILLRASAAATHFAASPPIA